MQFHTILLGVNAGKHSPVIFSIEEKVIKMFMNLDMEILKAESADYVPDRGWILYGLLRKNLFELYKKTIGTDSAKV